MKYEKWPVGEKKGSETNRNTVFFTWQVTEIVLWSSISCQTKTPLVGYKIQHL